MKKNSQKFPFFRETFAHISRKFRTFSQNRLKRWYAKESIFSLQKADEAGLLTLLLKISFRIFAFRPKLETKMGEKSSLLFLRIFRIFFQKLCVRSMWVVGRVFKVTYFEPGISKISLILVYFLYVCLIYAHEEYKYDEWKYIKYLSICNCKSAKPMYIGKSTLNSNLLRIWAKDSSRKEQKKIKSQLVSIKQIQGNREYIQ